MCLEVCLAFTFIIHFPPASSQQSFFLFVYHLSLYLANLNSLHKKLHSRVTLIPEHSHQQQNLVILCSRNLMEKRQGEIREACLQKWGIPDQVRVAPPRSDAATTFHRLTGLSDPSSWLRNEPAVLHRDTLSKLERVYDYRCFASASRNFVILSMGVRNIAFDVRKTKRLSGGRCTLTACDRPFE